MPVVVTVTRREQAAATVPYAVSVITADDVFEDVKALAERLGKKPVIVGDKAGFIANALLF